MNMDKKTRDSNIYMELLRFVIIGGYATLLDMAVEGWITSLLSAKTAGAGHVAAFFWMFLISVFGFILATPANWSLSSVWGFRNVDQEAGKQAKSVKGLVMFVFWSFLALVLGAFIQFIGYMICIEWSGWNIDILGGFSFEKMFGANGSLAVFWAWLIVFVIRTLVTLTFNYITRKLFIYKAPKQQ
jgi:putative flippase GtrA